jgi:hypothetical protein
MRVLTSGDDRAAALIANMIYVHRTDLDNRWWRLLYLALLWSGLTILKPRTGSEDDSAQRRRLRRARRLFTPGVSGPRCTVDAIRPLEVAKRAEEYEGRQWEEEYRSRGSKFTRDRSRRMSGALDTHFLEITFAWLLSDKDLPANAVELQRHVMWPWNSSRSADLVCRCRMQGSGSALYRRRHFRARRADRISTHAPTSRA